MAADVSIGIIGTGWVGTSVAISTLQAGFATEVLLHDMREEVAEGEAMDFRHGSAFYPSARVRAVTPEEMSETSAVVIAAGRGGEGDESRLALLRDNAFIIRDLARHFRDYQGIVVVVSNPVDVLTWQFQQASGLPPERVIGTGTMLDTARLRQVLGRELHMDPRSVHAQVVGEHGDSEVVLWSSATIGGRPLRDWAAWSREYEERISAEVRTAAYEIIRRKGATNHAIGLVTAALLRWMLRGERRVLTVSRVQSDLPEVEDVAISLPTIVGLDGAGEIVQPHFSDDERAAFRQSANVLRDAIASIEE